MSEGISNRYVNSSLGFEPQPIKPKGATVTTTLSSCLNFMLMLLIICGSQMLWLLLILFFCHSLDKENVKRTTNNSVK